MNGVLGIVLAYSLPYIGFLSAAVLVFLILTQGMRRGLVTAGIAMAILAVAAMLTGGSARIAVLIVSLLATWTPAVLLAIVTMSTRSLTLALQVSVLAVAIMLSVFFASVPDTTLFWQQSLETVASLWQEQGVPEMSDVVMQLVPFAGYMTIMLSLTLWTVHSGVFVLGCALFNRQRKEAPAGRFVDLNFGRLFAISMAVASLAATLIQSPWLESLAMFLFGVFWMQGLAVVHKLHALNRVPDALVMIVYACLIVPIFSVFAMLALALAGYADAWIDFRKRAEA